MAKRLQIEIVYARRGQLDAVRLRLAEGCTAGQALEASGLLERHPELDLRKEQLGIHGRRVPMAHALADGDRVEVYRPLEIDPKEARRARAKRRQRQR
ncbi:MAG TPA: RnfH family protein [Burkholderiales bacterium]|nr:RnfH family protein [Burkholderiales bacterium]HYA47629.1 RnfH family protein [Burkholderiales bacterium]